MDCVGNTAAATEFLLKWSLGPWVLTSIVPDDKTTTRTFAAEEVEDMEEWIEARQGKENLYFHVNPCRRKLNSKASKEDVEKLAWLHVDIDPRPGEDFDTERTRALKLLTDYKPVPTVIIDSGGGYQGFWKLEDEEKLAIDGNVVKAQELEAYNIQLEKIFGADHCHNVDRIMRIPGTVNLPTARKAKKGRVPVTASVVQWNEACYRLNDFKPAVRVQNKSESVLSGGAPKVRITGNVAVVGTEELKAWAKDHGKVITDHTLAVIATGQDPVDPTRYTSRSEALFRVCCDLVRAEVPEEMIYAVITGPNEIATSVREKRGWESYALRQIERAIEEGIDPHLRELNEKHAVIADMGGKTRIVSETQDVVMGRTRITKQSFEDFRNRYCHIQVVVGKDQKTGAEIKKPLGDWWIKHPQRRQYEGLCFAPGQETDTQYNLWKGFGCDAVPGDRHESLLKHILDNICSGNPGHFAYLVGWMARAVQNPACQGEVAVTLRGGRGAGKSFFVKSFGQLFGRHFLQVADSKHLVGNFNAHLRDTLVVFGDEAFFAGDKRHEGVLKTLVTEETLVVEGKGVDAEVSANYLHVLLSSNEDWVVPAGLDERRFFVLDVGDAQKQNHEYFKGIKKDLDGGGYENLLHFLMNFDISEFEVRKVPQTAALLDQKMLSMGADNQWFFEKIQEGRLLTRDVDWKPKVLKDKLYDDYIREMDNRKIMYRQSRNNFSRFLQKCCPEGKLQSVQETCEIPETNAHGIDLVVRRRAYLYVFPPLDDIRKHWDTNFGGPYAWPKWEGNQADIETFNPEDPPF